MRIPSGKIDIAVYFVALDSTTVTTRVTGLTAFTVYRSRNGAAEVAYTTPTITEIDATNMPGVYSLLVDEDTTIASTSDSEEYAVHITATGMAPVTRTIELYRRDWEASTANHTTAGTFGQKINNIYAVIDTEVAALQTDVTAVKAKTDALTFTVTNQIDANIQSVNEVTVTGAGTGGSPWGP